MSDSTFLDQGPGRDWRLRSNIEKHPNDASIDAMHAIQCMKQFLKDYENSGASKDIRRITENSREVDKNLTPCSLFTVRRDRVDRHRWGESPSHGRRRRRVHGRRRRRRPRRSKRLATSSEAAGRRREKSVVPRHASWLRRF